jgi:Flp pilus assembly protein protease CpaA
MSLVCDWVKKTDELILQCLIFNQALYLIKLLLRRNNSPALQNSQKVLKLLSAKHESFFANKIHQYFP